MPGVGFNGSAHSSAICLRVDRSGRNSTCFSQGKRHQNTHPRGSATTRNQRGGE